MNAARLNESDIAIPTSTLAPVQGQIQDSYEVDFNLTGDMAGHIQQLQSFINGYANCMTFNNSVTDQFSDDVLKFYTGNFDGRALQFISTSAGVLSIERSTAFELPSSNLTDTNDNNSTSSRRKRDNLSRRRTGAPW